MGLFKDAAKAVGMAVAIPLLGVTALFSFPAALFIGYQTVNYFTRVKENGNSFWITCDKDAPDGLIAIRGSGNNNTTWLKEWCDVKKIVTTCDSTLNASLPTLTKTDVGYTFTRPTKYCHVEYDTKFVTHNF